MRTASRAGSPVCIVVIPMLRHRRVELIRRQGGVGADREFTDHDIADHDIADHEWADHEWADTTGT